MFCNVCGAQLKDGAKFCVGCGTPVAQPAEPVNTPPVVEAEPVYTQPVQEAEPVYTPPVQQAAPTYTPPVQPQYQQPVYAAPVMPANDSVAMPVMALVFGILSIIFCWVPILDFVLALLAIIFGAVGVKKRLKGMAIAGLVIGIIFAIIAIIYTISFFVGLSYAGDYYAWYNILDSIDSW